MKKKKDEEPKIDWDDRKNKWINSVNDFYNNVNKWLYPFTVQSLLQIKMKEVLVSEEYLGTYKMNQLDILIGNDIISLIPRGALVVGGNGRIDMRGPKGEVSLFQKDWGSWKFINVFTKNDLWDANEDSFKSAIQDLVNG